MASFACVLLHTLLGIAWKYITVLTSSRGWSIVRVGNVIKCCWGCWSQYQLVSTCIEQRYFGLTINSPAVMIFPSIICVILKIICFWCENDNINRFVSMSVLLMASYLPDSTNEAILSLIPSRTTWCISSNVSEGVDFCDNWIMFLLFKGPNTGQ